MITVDGKPCNGVDLSHWNNDTPGMLDQPWLKFMGHKVTHFGGKGMVDNVDPKFAARRKLAKQFDIRWRAFYTWVMPFTLASPATQVELLARTVGELLPGESVYLDWEETTVTKAMINELTFYMNLEFGDRWFIYVNDSTPDMIAWLGENQLEHRVPVMHPNYNLEKGLTEARKWDSMIWQVGLGMPPGFGVSVPCDYVLKPAVLDGVCGRK